jgi:hypothetical protein
MMSMTIGQQLQPQIQPQSYQEILAAGVPVQPLDFPIPNIHRSYIYSRQTILNHHNHPQSQHHATNNKKQQTHEAYYDDVQVLCRSTDRATTTSDYGYWIKKIISTSTYGTVQLGVVVRKRNISCNCHSNSNNVNTHPNIANTNSDSRITDWITTDEIVAIKVTSISSSKERNSNNGKFTNDGPSTGKYRNMLAGVDTFGIKVI